MRKFLSWIAILGVVVAAISMWITRPGHVDPTEFNGLTANLENGAHVFAASGCASCHAAPGAEGDARLVLAGGKDFPSPFGTFYAPNISFGPNGAGIADWSVLNLADALRHGTSPDGAHYYPALPYTTYTRMTAQDITDLYGFMQTLPASDAGNTPHDVGFPFNIRLSLGGWKLLFFRDDWVMPADSPELERGRYLVEAMGHCAECHTPRNALGGTDTARWMHGAPDPSGRGTIPPLTPDKLGWTAFEIVAYLNSGFTPEFDTAGGEMVEVIENMKELPEADLQAIAAYLLALPPAGES